CPALAVLRSNMMFFPGTFTSTTCAASTIGAHSVDTKQNSTHSDVYLRNRFLIVLPFARRFDEAILSRIGHGPAWTKQDKMADDASWCYAWRPHNVAAPERFGHGLRDGSGPTPHEASL